MTSGGQATGDLVRNPKAHVQTTYCQPLDCYQSDPQINEANQNTSSFEIFLFLYDLIFSQRIVIENDIKWRTMDLGPLAFVMSQKVVLFTFIVY